MDVQLKSYMTTGVAIVGAGIIAVTPITALPPDTMVRAAAPPAVSLEVEPAGVVEDLLANIALLGSAGGMAADVILSGIGAVPRYLVTAVAAGIADPSAIPSLLSALVHLAFAPPGVDSPTSFIKQLTPHLALATSVLPEPLRDLANQVSGQINELIASFLGFLPDPTAGFAALVPGAPLPGLIGDIVGGIETLAEALGASVSNTLTALGGMPAMLAATFGAAIENPSDIPGLLSYLVSGVFAPTGSLIAGLINPLVDAAAGVPLVGGLIEGARDVFFDVVSTVLGVLPDPIDPFIPSPPPQEMDGMALLAAPATFDGLLPGIGDIGGLLPGIGDIEEVIEAMRTAVTDFVAGIGDVPELLGEAVRAVIANPLDFGRQAVTFLNYSINSAREGFQPIIAAVLGLLPEVIRTPLEQIGRTIDGVIISAQNAAQDFVERPGGGGPVDMDAKAGAPVDEGESDEGPDDGQTDQDKDGDDRRDDKGKDGMKPGKPGKGRSTVAVTDVTIAPVADLVPVDVAAGEGLDLTEIAVGEVETVLDKAPVEKIGGTEKLVTGSVVKKPVLNEVRVNGPVTESPSLGGGDTDSPKAGGGDGKDAGGATKVTAGVAAGGGTGGGLDTSGDDD